MGDSSSKCRFSEPGCVQRICWKTKTSYEDPVSLTMTQAVPGGVFSSPGLGRPNAHLYYDGATLNARTTTVGTQLQLDDFSKLQFRNGTGTLTPLDKEDTVTMGGCDMQGCRKLPDDDENDNNNACPAPYLVDLGGAGRFCCAPPVQPT